MFASQLRFVLFFGCILFVMISKAELPTVPPKFLDRELRIQAPQGKRFPVFLIENTEFVRAKHIERKACHQTQPSSKLKLFAASEEMNSIEEFVEAPISTLDLEEMEKRGLKKGDVARAPWSGDYWPYSSGLLGVRYMDVDFVVLEDWHSRFEYITKFPVSRVLEKNGQSGVGFLSPSEKYDLIVGDMDFALTQSMWAQGKEYYDIDGKVEEWMGLCHGWAPASIVEPRPVRIVEVVSPDLKWKVVFNPSEIKGLVSYNWATNRYASTFLGSRCYEKNPKRDKNGRVLNPDCFDLNPASWHLAVVNMVGEQKRSFVLDSTYDYEVWNQPIVGYSYAYFNPKTRKPVDSLKKALVSVEDFKGDFFEKFRSPEAKSFVGITMRVGYVLETSADGEPDDSPKYDAIRWVEYRYDLELNSQGQVIGGEWYSQIHPDFIWTPKNGSRPSSMLDAALKISDWVGGAATLPTEWSRAAQLSSPQGVILDTVTGALLKKASE